MTRDELLELAAIDAFGLLDDYEAALYTRSFHHAPAAVQDELKELQAAFAADPAFLPEVEHPEAMRESVLGAVARAVESESGELAPLALIGRTRASRGRATHRPANAGASNVWRAAALVLAAGNITFALFGRELHREYIAIAESVVERDTLDVAKALVGGEFFADYAGNPFAEHVVLTSPIGAPLTAHVFVKEHQDVPGYSLFLVATALPTSSEYRLEGSLDDGTLVTLEFTTSTSSIGTARIDVGNVAQEVYASFAKLDWKIFDAANTVVLSHTV